MMTLAREAQAREDFATAKSLLSSIVTLIKSQAPDRPVDATILQQLALVTYKSKQPSALEALRAACAILADLEPDTTNDTETLGLWGAVHKRLWQLNRDRTSLDGALRALERGFYIRNDYYNGINLAYLLNERALEQTDLAEATADFILARRVRREVRDIAEAWWKEASKPGSDQPRDRIYWALATLAEAALGLGDEEECKRWLEEATALKPPPAGWMIESSETQLASLRKILEDAAAKGIPLQAPPVGTGGGG
jgi:tetratricopeptide (TPR) repeat protein